MRRVTQPKHGAVFANQFDNTKAMAKWLGVTSVAYLSVEGMMKAVRKANESPHSYCNACFSANYPVPVELGVEKEENDW